MAKMTTIAVQAAAVDQFHELLIQDFRESLMGDLKILATGIVQGEDWKKKGSRGPVIFEMISTDEAIVKIAKRFNSHAIPLMIENETPDAGERAWVAWQEKWEKIENSVEMRLYSANLTFLWGSRIGMLDLFRADWDQRGHGAGRAGHPHWQFPDTLVDRVHFGMGGWKGANKSPECWQHYPDDCQGVQHWAKRTLDYSRSQIAAYIT